MYPPSDDLEFKVFMGGGKGLAIMTMHISALLGGGGGGGEGHLTIAGRF